MILWSEKAIKVLRSFDQRHNKFRKCFRTYVYMYDVSNDYYFKSVSCISKQLYIIYKCIFSRDFPAGT